MGYYRECPLCGANIDPGERCDCERERAEREKEFLEHTRQDPLTGQLRFRFDVGVNHYGTSKMAV